MLRHPATRLLFLLLSVGAARPDAAETPAVRKKLIEWGWDEPSTEFLRAHAREMEEMPFDGFVFHVPPIDGRNFVWTIWGPERFTWEGFGKPLADLKATKFEKLTDRFFRVNVTPGKVDWFDDTAWSHVQHNFGLAARFAKEGGAKGFMFDTEQYQGEPFHYAAQPDRGQRTFNEYKAKVRERGRQWMREVNRHFPDITILLTFGYAYAQPRADRKESEPSDALYGLLAPFLDGMFEACTEQTKIVDAWELSYGYKSRGEFRKARDTILNKTLEWTAEKKKYQRLGKAGFGVWMDKDGWYPEKFEENYFSPGEFESSVRAALEFSDEYVWIYTERPRWWTREKLPAEYLNALRNARNRD
ncbi:MAG: hypothetical protein AB7O26_01610 [Planctomycetaceae bacterium]